MLVWAWNALTLENGLAASSKAKRIYFRSIRPVPGRGPNRCTYMPTRRVQEVPRSALPIAPNWRQPKCPPLRKGYIMVHGQPSYYCTSLHWALQIIAFFYILRVGGNPALSKSIRAIFSNSVSSRHVSVRHFGNSLDISSLFIIIICVVVTCAQWFWCYYYDLPKALIMVSIF